MRTCGQDIDYRHKIMKMDGRKRHGVHMKNFVGTRFAVIAFKNYDERIVEELWLIMRRGGMEV